MNRPTGRYDIDIPSTFVGTTSVESLLASREQQLHEAVKALSYAVWGRLHDNQSARSVLAKIDAELLRNEQEDGQGPVCLYDAWDNPVLVVFPGRKWRTGGASVGYDDAEDADNGCWRDQDGTIRTFEERLQGPARNGRAYLVSAGPDGRFGNIDFMTGAGESFPPVDDPDFVNRPEYQHTLDNIYSYEVRTW